MVDLFGPSRRDRVQLISTLHALGPTSVPGVAAALSWSERRTQRTIQSALRHGDAPIEFDPVHRSVRLTPRRSAGASAPAAASRQPSPAPTADPPPRSTSPPPPPVSAIAPRCPACHTRLTAAGMPGLYVCSGCGELHHLDRGGQPTVTPQPVIPPTSSTLAPVSPAKPPASSLPRGGSEDRRSQELLAAWVTARPIPCPKCRTAMRHRGVAEYTCPSCGSAVTFDGQGGVSRSAAFAAPVPPSRSA